MARSLLINNIFKRFRPFAHPSNDYEALGLTVSEGRPQFATVALDFGAKPGLVYFEPVFTDEVRLAAKLKNGVAANDTSRALVHLHWPA